jgi:hypothetical protein
MIFADIAQTTAARTQFAGTSGSVEPGTGRAVPSGTARNCRVSEPFPSSSSIFNEALHVGKTAMSRTGCALEATSVLPPNRFRSLDPEECYGGKEKRLRSQNQNGIVFVIVNNFFIIF